MITSAIGKDPAKLEMVDTEEVTVITGTTGDIAVDSHKYLANNGALVTLTLPATCAVGNIFKVAGMGAGGWLIAQRAGQSINVGASASTGGVGGSIAGAQWTAIELICDVANTHFIALSSMGSITVT